MLTAAVGSDGFQGAPKCAAMLFQDRDQRIIVCPVIADIAVDNEIVFYCDLFQVFLQFQNLKRGTVIDLYDRIIGNLLMLCQFPFPVFFDDLPDFVHHFFQGIDWIVIR